ncbi:MAG: sigma-70 family RNA polymerase sigma factor [Clostridia bacterium]|nr:sigma-70 family RNA polymerase sigma factor [Clostridia bacterium]MDR3644087.1 sigma-70 family RNA polymerase sigma factor [Clostridia bacterium]
MMETAPPDAAYFSRLIEQHAGMVYRMCLMFLRSEADAQDAFQDVFLRVVEKRPQFNGVEHERAWLAAVTANRCRDLLRRGRIRRAEPIGELELAAPGEDAQAAEVLSAVHGLQPKYRRVVVLYYYGGFSTAELAAMLHCRETTVRSQLSRARGLLRPVLAGGADDER